MTILPEQFHAARALLGWDQAELAEKAHVPASAVASAERTPDVDPAMLDRVREALQDAGVVFIMNGVRKHHPVRPDAQERYERLMAIGRASAAELAGRKDLLTDADLYDENGLPA